VQTSPQYPLLLLSNRTTQPNPSETADAIAERIRIDVALAIRKVCPRWLRDQADDLTQIATSRVLDRIRATEHLVEFSHGYLYRAVCSALIDEIRKRRRLREVPIDHTNDRAETIACDHPESRFRRRELRAAIMRCLPKLMTTRRRAVMLHLQGHSIKESACILECDRRRADNLTYRGLADLRSCLTSRGIGP